MLERPALALAVVGAGCGTMTAAFELGGVRWSESSWTERTPLHIDEAPVTTVIVATAAPRLECLRPTEARYVTFTSRYGTVWKILAGFMVVAEGITAGALLANADDTGARVAGGAVALDAAATLTLMIVMRERVESHELPADLHDRGEVPAGHGRRGGRQMAAGRRGRAVRRSRREAAAAGAALTLRVGDREAPLPLRPEVRAGGPEVLLFLERPSFLLTPPLAPPEART